MTIRCNRCGSGSNAKWGLSGQGVQRYQCKNCGRRFNENQSLSEGLIPANGLPAHFVKGTSTLTREDGSTALQWVKTDTSAQRLNELAREAIQELTADIRGAAPELRGPGTVDPGHLTVYPWGDPHIGMYAWAQECGNDFDLKIAEKDLTEAMHTLVGSAPPTEHGVIVNLGDFFHADNQQNKTSRSGHQLDVDSRWPHVIRCGVRIMRTCIELAQQRHKHVTVFNLVGNHDDHSSIALQEILEGYFHNHPRVTVAQDPRIYQRYQFGHTLIGMTHGHTVKMANLAEIMAAEWPKQWGETTHRYWLTGHIHHERKLEMRGCTAESFQTLAPRDSYASSMGYNSGRSMYRITYSAERGEVHREKYSL